MNGNVRPWEESVIHVGSDAVLRGASVFEGIRAYRSADGQDLLLFRVADHFERLYGGSMRVLRMRIEYTAEQLTQGMIELLRANEVRDDAHVRVVAYFDVLDGAAKGESDPTGAYMLAFPKPVNARLESGVRSTISAWRRANRQLHLAAGQGARQLPQRPRRAARRKPQGLRHSRPSQ